MKVFKFGGASVRDVQNIENVTKIVKSQNDKILIVVSAMGKTTNALEKVVQSFYHGKEDVTQLLEEVKNTHAVIIDELLTEHTELSNELNDLYVEIDWLLEDGVNDSFDYIYDQIVSIGELLSSKILNSQFKSEGVNSSWMDVRDIIKTDDSYRGAKVDWSITEANAKNQIPNRFQDFDVIVTQGFIGSTKDNQTTTLGREGSDFTASILSYCLDALEMSIWKDVPGVLTADPKIYPNATKLDNISYQEAIEMTYYGAKVIHPKTIKPLENKGIILRVMPFNNPEANGTTISTKGQEYPPIIVIEQNQVMIRISSKDFSFVAEDHLAKIFQLLATHRLKVNLMRNTAISFIVCLTNEEDRISSFLKELGTDFSIDKNDKLQLITVRHYDDSTVEGLVKGKEILFEEKHLDTIQMVLNNPQSKA